MGQWHLANGAGQAFCSVAEAKGTSASVVFTVSLDLVLVGFSPPLAEIQILFCLHQFGFGGVALGCADLLSWGL